MNKSFSLFLFLLMFSLFITSGIESHPFIAQPNDCPPYWVPVYLNLNETRPVSIYIWDGMSLEYTATTNQSVIVNFRPNILVILESQYPFEVNGKSAWYANSSHPIYFYEFRANESMALNIDFLPKPLPNTPTGFITFGTPPNTTVHPPPPIIVTYHSNNNNYRTLIVTIILIFIIIDVLVVFLAIKKD